MFDCTPHVCEFLQLTSEDEREEEIDYHMNSLDLNFNRRFEEKYNYYLNELFLTLLYTHEGSIEEKKVKKLMQTMVSEDANFVLRKLVQRNWLLTHRRCFDNSTEYNNYYEKYGIKPNYDKLPSAEQQFNHNGMAHLKRIVDAFEFPENKLKEFIRDNPNSVVTPAMVAYLVENFDHNFSDFPQEWVEEYYGTTLAGKHAHVGEKKYRVKSKNEVITVDYV